MLPSQEQRRDDSINHTARRGGGQIGRGKADGRYVMCPGFQSETRAALGPFSVSNPHIKPTQNIAHLTPLSTPDQQ